MIIKRNSGSGPRDDNKEESSREVVEDGKEDGKEDGANKVEVGLYRNSEVQEVVREECYRKTTSLER